MCMGALLPVLYWEKVVRQKRLRKAMLASANKVSKFNTIKDKALGFLGLKGSKKTPKKIKQGKTKKGKKKKSGTRRKIYTS